MGDYRSEIAAAIVDFEARRDNQGRLTVYTLPRGDGGGTYEVAGINDGYHPHEAADLAALIKAGRWKEAEVRAAEYIASYTDCAAFWTTNHGIEAFLRDCVFNRGARGAARIFQLAVGADPDGAIGPKTRAAAARFLRWEDMLTALRAARELYERRYAHRDESSKFWNGLVNRWNAAVKLAKKYIALKGS